VHSLQARVKNGRLVMDEPTELPEGSVVPLDVANVVPLDVAKDWDGLDDADRARLHEALDEAEQDVAAGRTATEDELTVWGARRGRPPAI
jgi:hypothetical protein